MKQFESGHILFLLVFFYYCEMDNMDDSEQF